MINTNKQNGVKMNKIETAEKLVELVGGRVWCPKGNDGIVRVYLKKGFATILNCKVDINSVGGHLFDDVKSAVLSMGFDAVRL